MDNLIYREAAINAILKVPDGNWSQKRYAQEIRKQPSVDAVQVVYCKDCIHWDERKGEKYCEEMYFNQDDPKFYCGYAERREDAVD